MMSITVFSKVPVPAKVDALSTACSGEELPPLEDELEEDDPPPPPPPLLPPQLPVQPPDPGVGVAVGTTVGEFVGVGFAGTQFGTPLEFTVVQTVVLFVEFPVVTEFALPELFPELLFPPPFTVLFPLVESDSTSVFTLPKLPIVLLRCKFGKAYVTLIAKHPSTTNVIRMKMFL